jgi:hypothetical protein
MAVSSFNDFCTSLCGLVDVEPPPLAPDEKGIVGFTITCDGANVSFIAGEYGGHPAMLMAVVFGVPPEGREAEVLRSLMDANYMMTGMVPPAFVRNPADGTISLHQSYLLSQVEVESIYRGVSNAAAAVETWRSNPMMDESQVVNTHVGLGADNFA